MSVAHNDPSKDVRLDAIRNIGDYELRDLELSKLAGHKCEHCGSYKTSFDYTDNASWLDCKVCGKRTYLSHS